MEITYKRELKHNYLIIVPEESFYDSYEVRMMASNCIEGLLRFHVKQIDDRKSYYYEITSKQPLSRILEFRSLGVEELSRLIIGIVHTLGRMENYLLQEGQILLEPDFIYVEPEYFTVYLCLIPGRQGVFPEEVTALLQYLLGKVNHQDKECVVMAYGLYQESLKENYGMEDLLRLTGREEVTLMKEAKENKEQEKNEELQNGELQNGGVQEEEVWDESQWKTQRRKVPGFLMVCSVILGGPVLCWLFYGESGVREYWAVLAAADVITILCFVMRLLLPKRMVKDEGEKTVSHNVDKIKYGAEESVHEWQMVFKEELEEDRIGEIKKAEEIKPRNEECSTVLLTETSPPLDFRYLRSMKEGVADIVIAYVPFIIGKQEGLADYVLPCDTVSRLHARIDRAGETYQITDLNSTNGTMVEGRLLETNETVVLLPGKEVYIANIGFIFT